MTMMMVDDDRKKPPFKSLCMTTIVHNTRTSMKTTSEWSGDNQNNKKKHVWNATTIHFKQKNVKTNINLYVTQKSHDRIKRNDEANKFRKDDRNNNDG